MADRTQGSEAPVARTAEAAPQPTREALARVVARVRHDAEEAPAEYLRQSEVPGGGE